MRKKYPGAFKFKIAIEALKGDRTISNICREHNITPGLVCKWKKHLKSHGLEVFDTPVNRGTKTTELEQSKLYEEIGRLKVELDFLKKSVED